MRSLRAGTARMNRKLTLPGQEQPTLRRNNFTLSWGAWGSFGPLLDHLVGGEQEGRWHHGVKFLRRSFNGFESDYRPSVRHLEQKLPPFVILSFIGKTKALVGKLLVVLFGRHNAISS